MEKAVVAPTLRSHVAKEMRAEAEVKTTLGKVRELRTAQPQGGGKGAGKKKKEGE